ncbi:MAG: response regulator [Phycisphaerales bacterium]|nr:response regulator [Phycisphaerales bacterium]MCI0630722.1 response regulator [Phycisphaerales bacterium]
MMKFESQPDAASQSASPTSRQRILVVDDEAHIVQVLSLKLRNAGYDVLTAIDGEEGFELAVQHRPNLIITDFQMPYMTGLELCRELAANPETAGIPVVILTARGYALDPEDLTIGNIKNVLSKPFSPRAIMELIQRLLQSQPGAQAGNRSEVA